MLKTRALRLIIPAICLTLLAFMVELYVNFGNVYTSVLTMWMLWPFPHPFIDWEWLPSAAACWNRGVDVYIDNTCYTPVAHGRHNYSPLWLRATFLPSDPQGIAAVGLLLAVLFCFSLACLPPPRRRTEVVIRLLAATSSLTVYAIERGNADVILFLLAMVGAWLWSGRPAQRIGSYAIFTGMALLKFYPLVLLLLALRERVRVLAAVAVAASTCVVGFVAIYHDELAAALRNVPGPKYFFGNGFAAINLPYGLQALGLLNHTAAIILLLLLSMMAAAFALWLVECCGIRRGLDGLPAFDRGLLLAGAALICGCFFAGQSIGYRAIFLLLTLPGLLRLAQALPGRAGRMMFATCIAILFNMWVLYLQFWTFVNVDIPAGKGLENTTVGALHWLAHELAWWWIISVLLSTMFGFMLNSPFWYTLAGSWQRAADQLSARWPKISFERVD